MSIDGRLLAKARAELDRIRGENEREYRRRVDDVYARLPQLREIDIRLRQIVIEAAARALRTGSDPAVEIEKISAESLDLQAVRAEMLYEAGFPIDYADEIYNCVKCGDTGYSGAEMCDCLRALYNSEMRSELSSLLKLGEQNFDTFTLNYYDDFHDGANISPRKVMETVYDYCRSYAYKYGKDSMNLLFQGGTGLGKTFLSSCIARTVSERGYSVVYDTAVSIMEAFENQKFRRNLESEETNREIRRYLDCDLLIFDDLGTEMASAFTNSAIYTLVNTRLASGKKTIISTNLSNAEMRRRYSPQIMSRLEGEYQVLSFVGRDIRTIKKERALD